MSIFEGNQGDNLKIIEGDSRENIENSYKVYYTEFIEKAYVDIYDLFSGFDEIRAITFSYDIKFIDKIMKMFDYGEIILGARFMSRRDDNLHKLVGEAYALVEAMTIAESAADAVRGQIDLVERMSQNDLLIRSPLYLIDHRKIYLLRSDDGRTRVIKGSANMTRGAWSNNQIENIEVDDSHEGYEAYLMDFETAWDLSADIPEDVVSCEKTNKPESDIGFIKEAMKTREAIVLQEKKKDKETFDETKYAIELDKTYQKNKALLEGVKPDVSGGKLWVNPEKIKRIMNNAKAIERKRMSIEEKIKSYPSLTFNYDTKEAFINGEKLDLHPESVDVKNDVDLLFDAMDNYDRDFIGDTGRVRENHYKLLNILFSSPFHAKLRCVADSQNIPTSSLPLYTLITSTGANTGKTFMTKLILKLMSGKKLEAFDVKSVPTKNIDGIIQQYKGMPIFVDEIHGTYLSRLSTNIKNSQLCERRQLESQPLIIFAGNRLKDPAEPERKRMPFLSYDTNLKSDIDPMAYQARGRKIQRQAGNALYREYLRRMLDEVVSLIDYMFENNNKEDGYYPDITKISSRVLMDIFKDIGYELPPYVREFNWNDDFSYNAKYISEDAIEGIKRMWKISHKNFIIRDEVVIIEAGKDTQSSRTLKSWANSLPPEFNASFIEARDNTSIIVDKKELEKRIGFKFGLIDRILRGF